MFKSWLIFLFILNFSIFCATAKDSAQYFEEQLHLVEKKLLESSSAKKTQEIKSAEKGSELVSYTYEEPKKEGYKSAVSDSVKKVIEREEKKIAEVKRLPRKKIEIPLEEIPLDFMEQEEEENTESLPTFFSKLEHKSQTFNSKLRLKGIEFSLGESKKIIKEDLDFTALALRTEDLSVTQDISSVLINQNIKGQNLLAGKVKLSADYLPTYVNLFITEGESTEFIPFFTKQMVETKFPALRGGILLINLGVNPIKSVSDIKIDFKKKKKYQATYYDDKLEEVSEINLARYVLFTDVDLGNATVTYQFTDGREALKNIFIQEDALSYDVFAPVEIKSKFVNFYENIPLSQKTKDPLHLNENQLGLLSGKT
ncbi:MAG: hypothetical protein KBD63_06315, partial [Bacteriovoracaceae bacterium]|nr:hypothetical protein [Bacteriovoracaceae bacterium]